MHALFSPDSQFMRFMSRMTDLMLLNLLFLLTSLPIVTIGASSAAMYTVCFRMGTAREGRLAADYFRAFRAEFKQSTILWLLLLFFFSGAAGSAVLFFHLNSLLHFAFIPCATLAFLALMMLSYALPLQSRFETPCRTVLKNALLLSIAHLPRSLVIAAINALPVFLLLLDPILFLQAGFLWIALYFSAGAFCITRLLKKVFAPYLNQEEEQP